MVGSLLLLSLRAIPFIKVALFLLEPQQPEVWEGPAEVDRKSMSRLGSKMF